MVDGSSFDVFLSHNSADKPAVELLARRLEDEEGLNTTLLIKVPEEVSSEVEDTACCTVPPCPPS